MDLNLPWQKWNGVKVFNWKLAAFRGIHLKKKTSPPINGWCCAKKKKKTPVTIYKTLQNLYKPCIYNSCTNSYTYFVHPFVQKSKRRINFLLPFFLSFFPFAKKKNKLSSLTTKITICKPSTRIQRSPNERQP